MKELKTWEDIKAAHMKTVSAVIEGEKVEGLLYIHGECAYIFQNKADGFLPSTEESEKLVERYGGCSWCVYNDEGIESNTKNIFLIEDEPIKTDSISWQITNNGEIPAISLQNGTYKVTVFDNAISVFKEK